MCRAASAISGTTTAICNAITAAAGRGRDRAMTSAAAANPVMTSAATAKPVMTSAVTAKPVMERRYGEDTRERCYGLRREADELRVRMDREFNPMERARTEGRLREVREQEERMGCRR